MRVISKKEARNINAGGYYKCPACRYSSDYFPAYRDHMRLWHATKV